MAGIFGKPKTPKPPEITDKEIEEAKRLEAAKRRVGGRSSTFATPGGALGVQGGILGSASSLSGGIL